MLQQKVEATVEQAGLQTHFVVQHFLRLKGEELDTSAAAHVHPIPKGTGLGAGGRIGIEEGLIGEVIIHA